MSLDLAEILKALGGGPGAVAIVFLGWGIWKVLNWWREDTKEHHAVMREMQKESTDAIVASTEAVRSLTDEVRRNG